MPSDKPLPVPTESDISDTSSTNFFRPARAAAKFGIMLYPRVYAHSKSQGYGNYFACTVYCSGYRARCAQPTCAVQHRQQWQLASAGYPLHALQQCVHQARCLPQLVMLLAAATQARASCMLLPSTNMPRHAQKQTCFTIMCRLDTVQTSHLRIKYVCPQWVFTLASPTIAVTFFHTANALAMTCALITSADGRAAPFFCNVSTRQATSMQLFFAALRAQLNSNSE